MKSASVFAALALAASWLCGVDCPARGQQKTGLLTVDAELKKTVRTGTLKAGDLFLLRLSAAVERPGCLLSKSSSVLGRVHSLSSTGAGPQKIALTVEFEPMQCVSAEEGALQPVLVAVDVHAPSPESSLQRMATAGAESQQIAALFQPYRPTAPTSADTALTSAGAVSTSSALDLQGARAQDLKTGEVVGLHGVTLELPTKSEATTLLAPREIVLPADRTTFVLAMLPIANKSAPEKKVAGASAPKPDAAAGLVSRVEPEQPVEVCAATGCQQIAPPAGDLGNGQLWSVSLAKLGYVPRPNVRIRALETNATVNFLGDDELLVTFALHVLVKRPKEFIPGGSSPRKVRAVVFSRSDGSVRRVLDWIVPDRGSYVWPFGANRLLVHLGNDLVEFGPGLTELQRFALPGPLVFVSTAARGELALVATLHEKHTPAMHAELGRMLGRDQPTDENYDLTGLDANLHATGARMLDALPPTPAIFDSAMISVANGRGTEWQVESTTWGGTRKVLARLPSECLVHVSALAADLLLVRGCVPNAAFTTWYRVLNGRGATVLKGDTDKYHLLQQAATDAKGDLFAVASSSFDTPVDLQSEVEAGSFRTLALVAYDASSGKPVFSTHVTSGSPEENVFSLAPAGDGLALFTTEQLRMYAIQGNRR